MLVENEHLIVLGAVLIHNYGKSLVLKSLCHQKKRKRGKHWENATSILQMESGCDKEVRSNKLAKEGHTRDLRQI